MHNSFWHKIRKKVKKSKKNCFAVYDFLILILVVFAPNFPVSSMSGVNEIVTFFLISPRLFQGLLLKTIGILLSEPIFQVVAFCADKVKVVKLKYFDHISHMTVYTESHSGTKKVLCLSLPHDEKEAEGLGENTIFCSV